MKSFLHIKAKKIETIISYFDNHLWNVGIQKVRYYLDVVIHHPDWTIEDFEEEEKKLKEESDKLTEWPPIY